MSGSFDVIVVGIGAMGAATCSALARRGVRVLGLERFDIPHALGSSGGQTRLIRKAYFEHPDYVPLAHRAFAAWDELGARAGVPLLHRTGCLYLGRPDGELIAGARRAAAQHGLRLDALDARGVAERCGPFRMPDGFTAAFEPEAGYVLAERAVIALVEDALRCGAQIEAREAVAEWACAAGGVRVRTASGREVHAGHLVLTAGPWSSALLGDVGIALRVTRQPLAWFWPRVPVRLPCWAIEDDAPGGGLVYGFPMLPLEQATSERGLKVGRHRIGADIDPDVLERTPAAADVDDLRGALRRFLPVADGALLGARVCLYTMTPDRHFVVDRHPAHERVTIACGFSGHGFKFAAVLGEALADLAIDGRTALPIGLFAAARLRPSIRPEPV
jgi:sarcosine oxidase